MSSASTTWARRSAAGTFRISRPNATFWRTVMCGNSEYCWNTFPMSRLFTGVCATSTPSMRIAPASIASSPARARSAVVLPQPDGPRSETNSPGSMRRDSPARARCVP